MHVLLAAVGSIGDVLPMLGLGTAIRDAGHKVAVITPGNFRDDVLASGLDYVEFCEAELYEETTRELERAAVRRHFRGIESPNWPALGNDSRPPLRED